MFNIAHSEYLRNTRNLHYPMYTNIKNIFLHKHSVNLIPSYRLLLCCSGVAFPSLSGTGIKLRKITISLPKELKSSTTIIQGFSNLIPFKYKQFFLYKKEEFLYLDIFYIDRELIQDYKYAKSDKVFNIKSGKELKDKSRYNSKNSNHLLIKKGNKLPTFKVIEGKMTYTFEKEEYFSNSLEYEDRKETGKHFKEQLLKLKATATFIMNKLLNTIKSSKVFVVVSEYRRLGFKTLKQHGKPYNTKTKKVIDETPFINEQILIHNQEVKEYNYTIWQSLQDEYKSLIKMRKEL